MKHSKFLALGATILCAAITMNAHAKGQVVTDDSPTPAGAACMILVEGSRTLELINTQYIRNVSINKDDPEIVKIELASNYNNRSTFKYTYDNPVDAKVGLVDLYYKINKCRENSGKTPTSPAKIPTQSR